MAIEAAIALPLLLTLLMSAMVVGRTANAVSAVEMAAYDAARTASLARDRTSAEALATATVQESLRRQGHSCVGEPRVVISGIPDDPWAVPVGEPASAVVHVTCRVSFVDVVVQTMPTDREITRHFVSPIDQYRSRP
jgi:hypothetical protein